MGKDPKLPTIPELDNGRIYRNTYIILYLCVKNHGLPAFPEKRAFFSSVFQAENRELRKKLVETLRKGAGSQAAEPMVFWWFFLVPVGGGIPAWICRICIFQSISSLGMIMIIGCNWPRMGGIPPKMNVE
jgi:hypothetical protein